jgi:hypothetical protein
MPVILIKKSWTKTEKKIRVSLGEINVCITRVIYFFVFVVVNFKKSRESEAREIKRGDISNTCA